MHRGNHDIRGDGLELESADVPIREVVDGFFDKQDGVLLRETAQKLLWALPNEIPTQVAEYHDSGLACAGDGQHRALQALGRRRVLLH